MTDSSPTVQDKIKSWQSASPTLPSTIKGPPSPARNSILSTTSAYNDGKVEVLIRNGVDGGRAKSRVHGIKVHRAPNGSTQAAPTGLGFMSSEIDLEKRAWVRRKVPRVAGSSLDREIKHSVMPAKRLVSDGRWRKDAPSGHAKSASLPSNAHISRPAPSATRASVLEAQKITTSPTAQARPYITRPTARAKPTTSPILKTARSPSPPTSSGPSPSAVRRYRHEIQRAMRQTSDSSSSLKSPDLDSHSPRTKWSPGRREPTIYTEDDATGIVPTVDTPMPNDSVSQAQHHPRSSPRSRSFLPQIFQKNTGHGRIASFEKAKHKGDQEFDEQDRENTSPKVPGARIDSWLTNMDDPFTEHLQRGNDCETEYTDTAVSSEPRRVKIITTRRVKDPQESTTSGSATASMSRTKAGSDTYKHASNNGSESPSRGIRPASPARHSAKSNSLPRGARIISDRAPLSTILSESARSQVSTDMLSRHSPPQAYTERHGEDVQVRVPVPPRTEYTADTESSYGTRPKERRVSVDRAAPILAAFDSDERTYLKELTTLTRGIMPVMLDDTSSEARDAFGNRSTTESYATLQRLDEALRDLRRNHGNSPRDSVHDLLSWARDAAISYKTYLRNWRLGLDDVVVNISTALSTAHGSSITDGMLSRNEDGEVVDRNGDRIDVGHLLKRPLVRLKHLAKTFEDIAKLRSDPDASEVAQMYSNLVTEARRRANSERARLEDEAAASIDTTRARDIITLLPLADVMIDQTRIVKARDYFDLEFRHSSGQQLDCRVEMLLREDRDTTRFPGGDVLICEVTDMGRWLLFPPLSHHSLAVTLGQYAGELDMSVYIGKDERPEVLSLHAAEPDACEQWTEMLGARPKMPYSDVSYTTTTDHVPIATLNREPSSRLQTEALDLPLGEPARSNSVRWHKAPREPFHDLPPALIPEVPRVDAYEAQVQSAAPRSPRRKPVHPIPRDYDQYRGESQATSDTGLSNDYDEDAASVRYSAQVDSLASTPRARSPLRQDDNEACVPRTPRHGSPALSAGDMHDYENAVPWSAPARLNRGGSPDKNIKTPSKTKPRKGLLPALRSAFRSKTKRPSSPLKHEYAISTKSGSDQDSELSSEEEEDDRTMLTGSMHRDMRPFPAHDIVIRKARSAIATPAPGSRPTSVSGSPASSVFRAPLRGPEVDHARPARTTAAIFHWTEAGRWEQLYERDVCIVVSPGLLEAFDLRDLASVPETHQSPTGLSVRPLVSIDLTPLVPLRKGTALDISIRSPPMGAATLERYDNVMLRSRSPEECEILYRHINRARINNPTFIAMQRARGPGSDLSWAAMQAQRNINRDSKDLSWLRLGPKRAGSYRSKTSTTRSGTMSRSPVRSAISALRRMSQTESVDERSSDRRPRSVDTLEYTDHSRSDAGTQSDSNNGNISQPSDTIQPTEPPMGLGINNVKVRLYLRETTTRWKDLGSARLTITYPPGVDSAESRQSAGRRVIVRGTHRSETLLDEVLGERAFTRVARTGIAVSVYRDNPSDSDAGQDAERRESGVVKAEGGVAAGVSRVYMIQMASERECAFTFGLVNTSH